MKALPIRDNDFREGAGAYTYLGLRLSGRPDDRHFHFWLAAAGVGYGSLADITARPRHVRFTPDSGHSSVQVGCPLGARSGRDA
jgi:hypothetical protein